MISDTRARGADRDIRRAVEALVARIRPWILAATLTLVGLSLRLPWLGAAPNPAHDEGNWLLAAWGLREGRPVELPPDARFVTRLFAWLIAASWRVTHPEYATARLVNVVGLVAGALCAWWIARRMALPRAAVLLFALLAVHPWAVWWSRVAVVPYALSLSLSVLAPMAFVYAPRSTRPGLWRVLGAQLMALGFHFSPLAIVPAVSFIVWSLVDAHRRRALVSREMIVAALLATPTVAPVLSGALSVAARGTTRPSAQFDHLGERVTTYGRTLLGGLAGTSTVRDFVGLDLSALGECAVVALVLVALFAARVRRDEAPSTARDLASLSWVHLGVALLGLPLILAPVRQWHLPSVDAERYLFVALAPALTLWATMAERARHRWIPWAAALAMLIPTAAIGRGLLVGGGADRGVYTARGGGACRRWRTTADHVPVVRAILDEADRLAPDHRAVVVVADYVFFPIHFENARRRHTVIDASVAPVPERRDRPYLFVRWDDGIFAPGFAPQSMVDDNRRLDATMNEGRFVTPTRVRTLRTPDGAALVHLFETHLR
jgi:Dolichyl-phosphate-mannose-protein mannosyltransferase